MNLTQRVADILLKPKATWLQIEAESATVAGIYRGYLVALAGLSALCSFIGMSLIGAGAFGGSFRMPIFSGLVAAAVGFVMSLAGVYVLALIIDVLAPKFSAMQNRLNAFKVAAYGGTASLLAGVLAIVPSLAPIGMLASLYSLYLLYLGLPVLMKCPHEKAVSYTVVVVIAAIIVAALMSTLTGIFYSLGAPLHH
jgi:hypothetical protein